MKNYRLPDVPLTPMQQAARLYVATQVTDHPETHAQGAWEANWGLCGTTRCVAGWAQYFARGGVDDDTVEDEALEVLGLTYDEYVTGLDGERQILFYDSNPGAATRLRKLAGMPEPKQ